MAILSSDLIRQGAAGASTGYTIDQSIRFNSSDNPAMSKTFSGAGTNKTWTFSCWFKRGGKEETRNMIFSAGSAGNSFGGLELGHGYGASYGRSPLRFYNYTGSGYDWSLQPSMAFADFSAWYHVTVVCDTTNAVASERARIYVNGVRITDFNSSGITANSFPSLDFAGNHWMGTTEHDIGTSIFTTQNFDGYLAEIHNIDGQALDCNSFGEFNDSGIWIPKEYSGSYGTNGFKIDGRDASDLGDDESGNGNDFTTSGLQANDQKTDTPTNNMITFNPLNNQRSGGTSSNGNLDYVGPGTRTLISLTANIPSTGKWAIAFKVAQVSTNAGWQIGIAQADQSDFGDAAGSNEDLKVIRMSPSSSDLYIQDYVNSTGIDPSLPITTSDEFWVAVDMDSGNVYLGIYDESATTMKWVANDTGLDGNPATGDNPTVTYNTTQMPRDNVVFAVGSKQTSQHIYLQRSTDVSGTTPTGYTYFENVKDLL